MPAVVLLAILLQTATPGAGTGGGVAPPPSSATQAKAVRAGIHTIVLPKENAGDLDDLPEDVRKSLEVHLVEDLDEVLTLALRGARFEAGHLVFDGEVPVEPSLLAKHN